MRKRFLSFSLALIFVASAAFVGCGKKVEEKQDNNIKQTQVVSDSQEKVEKIEEPTELKVHFHSNNKFTIVDKEGNTLPVFQLAADKTNVKLVNTANPVAQKSTEEFQLQATEKFPADIYGGNSLKGPIFTYALQGAFLPLNDLIDQYGPNIKTFLDENEDIRKALTAPDGNIYMLNYIPDGDAGRAYFIRTDWLNKLNLEIPTNFDELEKVLYAFKNNDPNGNGMKDEIPYFNDKFEEMIRLANLWGARVYGFDSYSEKVVLDENDKMYHAWTAPEFKEAIIGMNQWYEDGIIDPEIFTRKANTARQTLWTKDNVGGMTHEWIASTSSYNYNEELLKTVPDFKAEAMLPVSKNGVAFEEHQRALAKPDGWAISANCKNPEAAIRFMDWFFTEEGRTAINFGIEGESYTMVDGKPTFTEEVLASGGVNVYLQNGYGAQYPIGYAQDFAYEAQWTVKEGLDAYNLYTSNNVYEGAPATPILNFTEEETEIFDKYITVLNEYQTEQISAFIIGKEDITTGWNSYIEKCKELGSEELVKIYQSAYERYVNNK